MKKFVYFLCLTALLPGCNCNDSLASAIGEVGLSLCDRGSACGCEDLPRQDAQIDFGSPETGATIQRAILVLNLNQPKRLAVSAVRIEDTTGSFEWVGGRLQSSDALDATSDNLEVAEPFALEGTERAELYVTFTPSSAGEHTATLVIESNSAQSPTYRVTLRGGGGASRVCVDATTCGDGSLVDFGTFNDDELSSSFDAVENIEVVNDGDSEIFVAVELTNDGVPETLPGDLVGQFGVFSLDASLGCTVVSPGQTLMVPVHYKPFTAGEHFGEVTLRGVGAPVRIPLTGRVIGAHICFRTEDDLPNDVLLTFGASPSYNVAANAQPQTRRIWARNCGYQEDLVISSVTAAAQTSTNFTSAALPWTQTGALVAPAAGEQPIELEVAVVLTPDGAATGTNLAGRYLFASNDSLRPNAAVDLRARIGEPERCLLVPSSQPLDFGWVATDEAAQGCDATLPFGCPGPAGQPALSRRAEVRLLNAGLRDCTGITFGDIELPGGQTATFTVEENPNTEPFTLQPGDSSEPLVILFVSEPDETQGLYLGKLPYTSPDYIVANPAINLRAKAGGSPTCELNFQPVSNGNVFCQQQSLAFGNVNIGQTKTIDLKLVNTGSSACEVTHIDRTSGTSAAFTFPTTPISIAVNSFAVLPVSWTAEAPSGGGLGGMPLLQCGQNSIRMNVNSGDAGAIEERLLSLSGNPTRPDIDVIPGEIDFGDVTVGCCSAERRVAIYNSGNGTLTITSVGILSSSDPTFTVTQPNDMQLEPGESTEFVARFCAGAQGAASGIIEILSSDDNDEYFTVSMRGTGTLSSEGHDSYPQPTRPLVDVLFAVDDSGSMGEEQNNLAQNFDSFISSAVTLDTDYHLGVITTDVVSEWAGKLYACNGNPRYITSAQPESTQRTQFRCNVRTTQSGRPASDAQEAGLQASRLALDYPNIGDYNAGFYREAAKLFVIIVTDEHDQSGGTPQLYVDFFRNLKGIGNPDLLNISAISGLPPSGCSTAEPNQFDYDAVTTVGGQFRNICAADWSDLITNLGLDVFNARRQFQLSRPATAANIGSVRVCEDNGSGAPNMAACVVVPQNATNGWTFDGATNSILFNGTSIPGPGKHVLVDYVAVCF